MMGYSIRREIDSWDDDTTRLSGRPDWYKPIERKDTVRSIISVEMGRPKNNYFFSVGYLNEKGYVINWISTD